MATAWLEHVAAEWPPLAGEHRTRVAVIGGGLAGVSAAYHLARAGVDGALVERGLVGGGATGKSTGMLTPGVGPPVRIWQSRFGDDEARRVFQATLDAVSFVKQLVRDESLACDLEENGQLVLARGPRAEKRLRLESDALRALGFDVRYEEGLLAPHVYRGGLRHASAAILDPVKLCRELARAAQRRGARIHEGSSARALGPGRVELDGGALRAERVVVATDGAAAELGLLRGRVVPLYGHVVATAPVDVATLGWPRREGVIDARSFFDYFRLTADDRLVFGGGRTSFAPEPRTWDALARELVRVFPALEGVAIEKRWAGPMGMTLDRMPIVGELDAGTLYTGAWCGHGIALSVASGAVVRDRVLGLSGNAPWERASAPWLPWDPLARIGIHAYMAALAIGDRIDEGRNT